MSNPIIIEGPVSRHVITVGEYYSDQVHGGIASVLRYYEPYYDGFQFIPSSRYTTFWSKLKYDLFSLFRLGWKLLWDRKIEIVHIHTASGGSFRNHMYYARIAKWMGRKVVLHCHAAQFHIWYEKISPRMRRRVNQTLSEIDRLIVLSQSWKELFTSLGVAPDKIVVLNNITPDHGGIVSNRADNEPVRLLFLGEIGPRKGVFDVLSAMKDLSAKFPGKFHLDIGGNKMEQELKEKISQLGLFNSVCFHGFVSGEKKDQLLQSAHVFILPSWNEGLPIAILEAMSYGCAIISTPVGGIPEVVKGNGILVEPGNVEEIASAISRMADDAERTRMGGRSLEIVRAFYPEAVLSHLRAVYLELLSA